MIVKYLQAWKEWGLRNAGPNLANPRKLWRTFLWDSPIRNRNLAPFVVIDPIVRCNLQCPLCSVNPRFLERHGQKLAMEDFRRILDKVRTVTNMLAFCHA